ncbi:hypothetical protein FKP32DRAFT_1045502 [Trametes sanguinea]|nr:hypothetical protein FKP32DRAFT_1045502 [Trametes sanguinea]
MGRSLRPRSPLLPSPPDPSAVFASLNGYIRAERCYRERTRPNFQVGLLEIYISAVLLMNSHSSGLVRTPVLLPPVDRLCSRPCAHKGRTAKPRDQLVHSPSPSLTSDERTLDSPSSALRVPERRPLLVCARGPHPSLPVCSCTAVEGTSQGHLVRNLYTAGSPGW